MRIVVTVDNRLTQQSPDDARYRLLFGKRVSGLGKMKRAFAGRGRYSEGMKVVALFLAVALVGCVSAPVAAKSSRGEKFLGTANATPFSGTFELTSLDGVTVDGTYNQFSDAKLLRVDFTMSDGRHGTAMILRDRTLRSGMGSGKTTDGTTFDFLMGDSVSQAQVAW